MALTKQLWSASLTTPVDKAETLSEALSENSLALTITAPPRTDKAKIEAIYAAPPDAATLQMRLAILAALNGIEPPQLTIRELPSLDWIKKVSETFPPLPIARWIVYGKAHREKAQLYRRIPLQIDATSAFGTGEHPTTRGCLLMLDWALKKGLITHDGKMLDMGCGSGILAMAYAKTARARAVGIDLDADSITIAKDNRRINGLNNHMRVALGNGYTSPLVRQHAPYDLIMANIFAGPLCRMAHNLKNHLKPRGIAILSGLLTHQANHVLAAHRLQGLRLVRHMKIGEWSVLALTRPSRAE